MPRAARRSAWRGGRRAGPDVATGLGPMREGWRSGGQPGAAHRDVAAGPGLPQLVRPHQLPGPCRLACTRSQLQLPQRLLLTRRHTAAVGIRPSMQGAAISGS